MWINTNASHTWMCNKAALTRRKRRNMHVCRWYIYIYICHGAECSNYHKGSELCNIANGHPINSAQRVLNNTEVKERNTISLIVAINNQIVEANAMGQRRAETKIFPKTRTYFSHIEALQGDVGLR